MVISTATVLESFTSKKILQRLVPQLVGAVGRDDERGGLVQAVSRPEGDAFAFEGAKLLLKFVLVGDAVASLFWSRVGTGIGEQVVHRVQKIDLVLLQEIADFAILIAEVCVLKPVIELPEICRLGIYILVNG
jgi:hypothetical protein